MEQCCEMSDPSSSPTPWTELDAQGNGLTVDAFLTTLMSQVGSALRRTITVPYATQFGLSVSEWRVLSLVAHAGRIAFADLVTQSSSDKALVSRTLKLLEERALIGSQFEGNTPRKKRWCVITPEGDALHRQAIPIARAKQAGALLALPADERDAMYRALLRLRDYCRANEHAPSRDDLGPMDI